MTELIIDQRRRSTYGFQFGRVLPSAARTMVGPFVFFDHMGPSSVGRELDIRPHPHIGLAAVTYLFKGEIIHRDSVGSEQLIRPGDVNWMTAGKGITHSERFPRARADGDQLHCLQSWVALPNEKEEASPSFAHYKMDALPTTEDGGVWTRLIAGAAFSLKAPTVTHSPLFLGHHVLATGARLELPTGYSERSIYIVSGSVNANGTAASSRQMIIFRKGVTVISATEPTHLISLGGEPVGERFVEWNFVSSSPERIRQAKADWQAGRMKLPHYDKHEFIPLPAEPCASSPPM